MTLCSGLKEPFDLFLLQFIDLEACRMFSMEWILGASKTSQVDSTVLQIVQEMEHINDFREKQKHKTPKTKLLPLGRSLERNKSIKYISELF